MFAAQPLHFAAWATLGVVLGTGHWAVEVLRSSHCLIGTNFILLAVVTSVLVLGARGWRAAVRRFGSPRPPAELGAKSSAGAPGAKPAQVHRMLVHYGDLIAAGAALVFMDAVVRAADVSCRKYPQISDEVVWNASSAMFRQLEAWTFFVLGCLTAHWGASSIAGRRSSWAAVTSVVAHLALVLLVVIAMLASAGMLPS